MIQPVEIDSGDRERRIPWRTVIVGLGLQAALAVLLIRVPPAAHLLLLLNRAALAVFRQLRQFAVFTIGVVPAGKGIRVAPGLAFWAPPM